MLGKKSILFLNALILTLLLSQFALVTAQEDGMINGFPTTVQLEADTAQAAFEAADRGNPDPAWNGQRFTIAVFATGQRGGVASPLYFWRNKFEEITGATYDIVELPWAELREKIYTDLQTGTGAYDAFINCSHYYGDYIVNDWIEPLNQYFDDPRFPQWDRESIAPAVAQLYQWGGTWYGTNNDHDTQLLYYRRDILENPEWQAAFEAEMGYSMPVAMNTWEEVLEIAQFFNGKDWNGDGDPDNGISLPLKVGGQAYYHYMALSAAYTVLPYPGDPVTTVDQYHNVYWFDPVTMDPLINSPGHVRALEMLLEFYRAGSEAQTGWALGEAWADFLSGNSVLTFTWGDVGRMAQDPSQSQIQGLLGVRGVPGTLSPYDRQSGEFLTLEEPNMVANLVGCTWHPVISRLSQHKELTYYFMAWQATPEINRWNATAPWTGIDPGTTYDLFPPYGTADLQDYIDFGYDPTDAQPFINAFGTSFFEYPIFQNYLRIPTTPELHEIWDVHISEAMTGQLTPQEALDRTFQDWTRIIDDYGREELLELYQQSIGYVPQ